MKQKQAVTATQSGASKNVVVLMQHVNKWFGQFHVLRDINLTVEKANALLFAARPGQVN
jgi:general L-amino acid transport system ATP-binding protein